MNRYSWTSLPKPEDIIGRFIELAMTNIIDVDSGHK